MKKVALRVTIYIVVLALLIVLASPSPVMASPARIEDPSLELATDVNGNSTYWTYSETDADYITGTRSDAWKTQVSYSYLFSSADPGDIAKNAYCQILQSVDFTSIDRISFDAYLGANSNDYSARMLVGATEVWTLAVPESDPVTPTEYLHLEVDLSGQSGSQNLIIQIYADGNAANSDMLCYFDNIKIWGSHSDSGHTTVENSFAGVTNHVYMYGENFDAGTTKVGYYDGNGDWKETDTYIGWAGGTLDWSECLFIDYMSDTAAAGDWHAVVLLQADDLPATYDEAIADPDYIAGDVFGVDATAIPEFPTVMAAIGVAGLCFGIYYWMRRKRHSQIVSSQIVSSR